jgi:hypothetical protein
MPPLAWLAIYLLGAPLLLFLPMHRLLTRLAHGRRRGRTGARGRRPDAARRRRVLGAGLVVAAATALAACGPTVRGTWEKPAVEPGQQRRDEYACTREATFAAQTEAGRAAAFAACMRSRGYAPLRR